MGHMDLSPLFGPGGVKSIAALLADYPQRDWGTWVMNLCMSFSEDEEGAARLAIWLGYLATVFGIGLCGFRFNAWAGARVSALITLCFAPLIWNTVLVGPDGIATGVAWLGIGIAWSSTKGTLVVEYSTLLFWGCTLHLCRQRLKSRPFPVQPIWASFPCSP